MEGSPLFSKTHYRRTFALFVLLAVLALLVIKAILLAPDKTSLWSVISPIMGDLIDNLIASLVVTLLLGLFVFWLTPSIMEVSKIQVIEPTEIGSLLEAAMPKTELWWYKGATGRYLLSTTLPKIKQHARKNSTSKEVVACILDPRNLALCESYANYRRSLNSAGNDTPWNQERVSVQCFATVLACLAVKNTEPLVRVTVYLLNSFSVFRLDISSSYAIVTKEDKLASAIRCDAGSYYYSSYKDEVVLAMSQSTQMNTSISLTTADKASVPDVQTALRAITSITQFHTADFAQKVLKDWKNSSNPYK